MPAEPNAAALSDSGHGADGQFVLRDENNADGNYHDQGTCNHVDINTNAFTPISYLYPGWFLKYWGNWDSPD